MLDKIQICEQVTPDLINWSFAEGGAKTSGQFIKGQPEFEACQSLPVFTPLNMDEYNAKLEAERVESEKLEMIEIERKHKMNAFIFKGISCSITNKDRSGWVSVSSMINDHILDGGDFIPFTFYMENGNKVRIESKSEWDELKRVGREIVFDIYSKREI